MSELHHLSRLMNGYRSRPFWAVFILVMLKMILFRQFAFGGAQAVPMLSDAAAALTLLCVLEWITTARWKFAVFTAVNGLLSLILLACTVYFNYFGSIPTYTALHSLDQVAQVKDSVGTSMQWKNGLFFADLLVLALLYPITFRTRIGRSRNAARAWMTALLFAAGLTASFLFIRMDRDISNELVLSERLGVLNYQVAMAMKDSSVELAASGSIEETKESIAALFQSRQPAVEPGSIGRVGFGAAEGKNVIVVQLEAFQDIMIGLETNGREVTPVLNELVGESYYFTNVFQQIGQGNTSDAEFLSNTGVYPAGSVAMSKGFGDREMPSLPRLLADRGYESVTFHINDVTFWDRNRLYPALGFGKYYEKSAFNNDHFNSFGASDKEMYRVGFEKLSELARQHQPFYAQFVTTSSHHPFKVPADIETIELPKPLENTQLGHYIQAVHYTDRELGVFIERLKEAGMWDNTVMVVYGDHFGLQTKDNDPKWVEEQLGVPYHDKLSRFNIPLIVRVPGVQGETLPITGGQVDIMPTIANLLGIDLDAEGYTVFGQDLLNAKRNVIGMRYYLPTGSFFNDEILFIPGKGFDDGTAFDLDTYEPVDDFSRYREDYDYVLELMKLSDEYMKRLPKRK